MTLVLSLCFLFNWITSNIFIRCSLLNLFFFINFIIELNKIDLLNIGGYSLHLILFGLLLWNIDLATHVASSDVVVMAFAIEFEPSQQTPFDMGNVYNSVTVSS
jgi:hypothetical protein